MSDKKITVVVPAYNEEHTIHKVVQSVKQYCDEVVVVNDCSGDKTQIEANNAGAIVLFNENNLGYDKSINKGFEYAFNNDADIVVTFDADGQHKSEDIPRVVKDILDGNADIVLTDRGNLTHFAEKVFAFFSKKYGISDPLSGMKAYSKEVYNYFGFFDNLNSIGTQLSFAAAKVGFRLSFVDIQIKEREDQSRFYSKVLRANVKILKAMFKVFWYILFLNKNKNEK